MLVKCKFSNFEYVPMQQQKSNSTIFFLCEICDKAMIAQKGIIDTFNICNNCKIWICCSHIIICCECSESFCTNCVRKETIQAKYPTMMIYRKFKCKLCCNKQLKSIKQEKLSIKEEKL